MISQLGTMKKFEEMETKSSWDREWAIFFNLLVLEEINLITNQ